MLTSSSLLRLLALILAIALAPSVARAQVPADEAPAGAAEEGAAAEPDPQGELAPPSAGEQSPVEQGEVDPQAEAGPQSEVEPQSDATTAAPTIEQDLAAQAAEAESEEELEEIEEIPPPAAPPIYRGSMFSWQHGMTVNTLNPAAQLTYNPTYYWSFFLQPRLYVDSQNFFVLSQGLSIEWTEADFATTDRELQLSDTVLEWRHTEVLEGFVFISSVRLAAPLSVPSQAADRVLNTGVGLTVVRVIPEALNMTVALTGAYRHWWGMSNVATTTGGSESYRCNTTQGAGDCDQVSGFATERDRLLGALTVTIAPVSGLTITSQYVLMAALGNDLATVTNPAVGGPDTIPDGSVTHWRNFQYWTLAVAYDVVPWLNLSLGYQSSSSASFLYNDDGSVLNPFYNPYSELYLTATLAIDGFIDEIDGSDEGDGLTPEERQRRRQGLSYGPRSGGSF